MQLKNKIIQLTGFFIVLLGIAGGMHLWVMQSRMNQTLILHAEQRESVLIYINQIHTHGLKMIEIVSEFAAIESQADSFPPGGISEAGEMLAQFNDHYALVTQELRELADHSGWLACDAFPGEIKESADHLYQSGLLVFGAMDHVAFNAAQREFAAAENNFLYAIEKASAQQAAFFQDQISNVFIQSKLFFWTYFATWTVISVLFAIAINRFCINILERIAAMNRMVERAGKGDFYMRLHDEGKDELADLACKMNDTAAYLAEARASLERTTSELALQLAERKAAEAKLAVAATHDSLTGLPNRASFFDQFNHAIALADRKQENMALLFLDMDGLKIVNDAFGHDGGDMLIQQVGDRLQRNIRKSDYVARLAGDEFVVILENLQRVEEDVSMVCTKLLKALAEPYDIRGRRIKLSASIGVSLFPIHGYCVDELLHKADSAMYRVKNGGKNNFAVFELLREE